MTIDLSSYLKCSINQLRISIDLRIESLLKRTPSGPHFTQSTIGYCNDSIEAAVAKFGDVLSRKFPGARDLISTKVEELTRVTPRNLPKSSFATEGDKKFLEFPNGSRLFLNRTGEAIYLADPSLGVFQYIVALYPPRNPRYTNPRYTHDSFPWFNGRLTKMVEVGGLELDDPRIAYIALGYVTQVGKALANSKVQMLLKKAQPFAGVDSQEKVLPYLDTVGGMVGQIRGDQAFLIKGFSKMHETAEANGLDELQTQLLLDIAFIRNRAFDLPSEFKQALEPLIRLIAACDWEEAFLHRDFLLNHFLSSFPAWRGREQRASGAITFESFKELAKAVVQKRLEINAEDVPSSYREVFGNIFPAKVERAQKIREEAIVKRSVGLSNTLVKELAVETANMMEQSDYREIFGENTEEVKTLVASSPVGSEGYDWFIDFVRNQIPGSHIYDARNMFLSLSRRLNTSRITTVRAPYRVRIPGERPILNVEMMDKIQACWYATDQTVDVRIKGQGTQVMMKNWLNFGRLMYSIILLAYQQPAGKIVLNLNEVKSAFTRAYQTEKEKDPIVREFTLPEYLKALIHTVHFPFDLTDEDPVMRFIRNLET